MRIDLSYSRGVKDLFQMPAAFPRGKRMVSTLSGALHLEPGKLCESWVSAVDDPADRADDIFLGISIYGRFPALMFILKDASRG
jgi:hypothetical protein